MVGADCGRSDNTDTGVFQQRRIASGTGSDNQRVGIADSVGVYICGRKPFDFGHSLERIPLKGDKLVDHNLFHGGQCI